MKRMASIPTLGGHHLVNQQPPPPPPMNVQHGSGRSGGQHQHVDHHQPPETVVSNVRLDNNPKKRMISQQHQQQMQQQAQQMSQHHQEHAQHSQHAAQSSLPIPIHHPIGQLFALDHQQAIKTENDKLYHFPPHTMSKPQILSDTKLQPSQMFDIQNLDGQIVHVNIEDINQFLTYHEVFGKISNSEHAFPPTSNALTIPSVNTSTAGNSSQPIPLSATSMNPPGQSQAQSTPLIIPKIENISGQSNANTSTGTSTFVNNSAPTCVNASNASANDDQAAMPSPAMHTCEICEKVFPFKYQYIVHRRYHNERKPFICQVCGQAFTTTLDLQSHGKIHDGVKMFMCNICYNVFANDSSLQRHMKRHSTDKPYGCSVCQKTFARKEHLENHFRSHSGETPFRCQYCAKM